MEIFHFSQFEHELFCWYLKRLNAFLAQNDYCVGKWKILGIVDEGVNSETRILLQFWDFHCKSVDEAWNLLEWVAWDSFMDIHFMIFVRFILNRTIFLFGVICVIILSIMLVHVLLHTVLIPIRLYHSLRA